MRTKSEMNPTTVAGQAPKLLGTCPFCGHAGTHAPPAVSHLGGVKYCSNCPECETALEQMVNTIYAARTASVEDRRQ